MTLMTGMVNEGLNKYIRRLDKVSYEQLYHKCGELMLDLVSFTLN